MNGEKQITTVEELAVFVAKGFEQTASKKDLVGLATKEDLTLLATKEDLAGLKTELKADMQRVENKLDSVIDNTLPAHDRRISRVEKVLKLPKLV